MAKAFIAGVEQVVRVDKDLGDSWAVSVADKAPVRVLSDRPALVVKLQGNDREAVLRGALEILKKAGKIDSYELDPSELPPPPPEKPAAAPAEAKPAPAAEAKAAPAAPAAPKPPEKA